MLKGKGKVKGKNDPPLKIPPVCKVKNNGIFTAKFQYTFNGALLSLLLNVILFECIFAQLQCYFKIKYGVLRRKDTTWYMVLFPRMILYTYIY